MTFPNTVKKSRQRAKDLWFPCSACNIKMRRHAFNLHKSSSFYFKSIHQSSVYTVEVLLRIASCTSNPSISPCPRGFFTTAVQSLPAWRLILPCLPRATSPEPFTRFGFRRSGLLCTHPGFASWDGYMPRPCDILKLRIVYPFVISAKTSHLAAVPRCYLSRYWGSTERSGRSDCSSSCRADRG